MKLSNNASEVERGGITRENEFTIKTTAKAFDILSSGLYSDKVLAIVRELSCNAYDAHVAAGTEDTPFVIHLPNTLEPYFSVKDFGTGLSDEDIRGDLVPVLVEKDGETVQAVDAEGNPEYKRIGGLYTTYFDSTKTESNDFIGALGLGSKSPFSYTRAFEVISRHNGTIRTYAIFINEQGVPSVAMLSECDTLEPNGLEVKLTVRNGDFYSFVRKTSEALRYFPSKPKVVGDAHFKFNEMPEVSLKSQDPENGWALIKSRYDGITVIQGNVPYPLDKELVEDILSEAERQFIRSSSAVLYFKMGELEVAASREAIQYDPRTKQNIKNKIAAVLKDITVLVNEKINKPGISYWKLAAGLNAISQALFGSHHTLSQFLHELDGVGSSKLLKRYIEENGYIKFSALRLHKAYQYRPSAWANSTRNYRRDELYNDRIEPEENVIIVLDDLLSGGPSRIGYAMEKNPDKQFYCLTQIRNKDKLSWIQRNDKIKDLTKAFHNEKENWIKELCSPPLIIKASDLPVRKRDVKRGKRVDKFYVWDQSHRYPYKGRWKLDTDITAKDGGYYVITHGVNRVVDHVKQVHKGEAKIMDALRTVARFAENRKAKSEYSTEIVGVRPSIAKKLQKSKKWVNVHDLAVKFAADFKQMELIKTTLDTAKRKQFAQYRTGHLGIFDVLIDRKIVGLLSSRNTALFKVLEPLQEIQKELSAVSTILEATNNLNISVEPKTKGDAKPTVDVDKISTHIQTTYPMLYLMDGSTALQHPEIVVSYIQDIESKLSTGANTQ